MSDPYNPPSPVPYPPQAMSQPAQGHTSGLAIAAIVMSALALVGVVVVAAFVLFSGGGGALDPLTGHVSSPQSGALSGSALAQDVSDRITQDGGDVADMRCPDTPAVKQGVVTVCHGSVSGDPYAVAVFFEDAAGAFTISVL